MDLMLTHEKLARRIPQLGRAAVRARQALGPVVWCAAGRSDLVPPTTDEWQELVEDEYWGAAHGCVWLRASLEVPPGWRSVPLELALLYPHLASDETFIGFEANLYVDGALYAGIDMFHRSVLLPAHTADGAAHQIDILVYTRVPLRWEGLELRVRDEAVWQLHQQLAALFGVAEQLDRHSPARYALLAAVNTAYNQLDLRDGWDGEALAASAAEALQALAQTLAALPQGGARPQVVANGHAHMDVAWLWPVWRTRQKIAHTVATALLLMERDAAYVFSMSQPQTFAYLKHDHPQLYARLKERVKEGRFEPIGNMWVEADCNLASGEALIRQILHGAAFFEAEFGVESPIVWLPDVFGYTAALPQIMRGCGISTFVTTKLSWSQTNRFPYDTFRWRGLDGSEVLAHIISAPTHRREVEAKELMPAGQGGSIHYTYNGVMEPWQVHGLWRCYREQALNDELLYLYGAGDGGGGPTEGMLAAARTMAELPDFPQVRLGAVRARVRAARLAALGGRAIPRISSGHLHQPGAHQARQPP
jgi:alpha-mannosidase